ncbi:MAG: hypothetical protein CBB87_07115 [Micavibrio sp. TMED27]|nr:hypothetical protein [Micavibrio sp.]OUT90894.1 MAG: hypothetical protein CBB87_07115 [Micavibrio sp. TMED27]|tara:strand:+ start:1693 stop:2175 length:483 start_codon:yes stop_codon:yes gene_type:complete
MTAILDISELDDYSAYARGDYQARPWGWYEVLNAGIEGDEEFCEKRIGVRPFQALSLQRHKGRREFWKVEQGELKVILDGQVHTLKEGDTILIPRSKAHCMINATASSVIIYEKKMGVCREDDNERLYDAYGRDTVTLRPDEIQENLSVELYKEITEKLA